MDEDELDPRIQVELEKLNTATDEINKLEIELDEANTTFRMLLGECTRRLKIHSSKNGSAIVSARPYYEALDVARIAQQECQQAAVSFQRANEVHEAAKETVALAEARFMSQQPEWRFDSAWQEMLNHATLKVRDAEKQRAESAAHHGQATARYKDAQDKVHQLDQRLRRNVAKSRPYFEEKGRCNDQLAAQKEVVEALQAHVAKVKAEYAASLRRLEGISEEIHRKRADILAACSGVREPGVGAELEYRGELNKCDGDQETSDLDYDLKPVPYDGGERLESNRKSSLQHSFAQGDTNAGVISKMLGLGLEEKSQDFNNPGCADIKRDGANKIPTAVSRNEYCISTSDKAVDTKLALDSDQIDVHRNTVVDIATEGKSAPEVSENDSDVPEGFVEAKLTLGQCDFPEGVVVRTDMLIKTGNANTIVENKVQSTRSVMENSNKEGSTVDSKSNIEADLEIHI